VGIQATETLNFASPDIIWLKVPTSQIDIFNKFIEAYDNLAVVTTFDVQEGILALWVTPDTKNAALKIIRYLPCQVQLIAQPPIDKRK